MQPLPGIRRFFRLPSTARTVQDEVDDELAFHIDTRTEALVAVGMTVEAARDRAEQEFGDLRAARSELAAIGQRRVAQSGRTEWWRAFWADARYTVRALRQRPGFTAVVLTTLAIGIGANTAIFTVVDAALFRSLPYREPEQLVHLWETAIDNRRDRSEASYPDFEDWRKSGRSFAGMAGYQVNGTTLTGRDVPLMLGVTNVTPGFFDVLGVRARVGRLFHEGQDRVGDRVVVVSHGFWRQQLSGESGVVGRRLTLAGVPHVVIGVLPETFHFAPSDGSPLWTITDLAQPYQRLRGVHWLNVIARLKPGASLAEAGSELSSIVRRIGAAHPDSHAGREAAVIPLRDEFVGTVRPLLLVLLAAVSIVLLVAGANVAGLLLGRAAGRQQELAIRAALGAGRGRIIRQLLTESVVLSALGAALGLAVAHAGVRALVGALPEQQRGLMPYLDGLGVDLRVFGYAIAVALLTGALFGLAPAVAASRPSGTVTLAAGASRHASGRRRPFRSALVATEIALTLVLLVAAGLLTQSLARLLRHDLGFRPEGVLTAAVVIPESAYPDSTKVVAFFGELVDRVERIPGVTSVGLTSRLPLAYGNALGYVVASRATPPPGERPIASVRAVSTNYFESLGVRLLRGRAFTSADTWHAPSVIVVNRALARQQFGTRSPIGHRLAFGANGTAPFSTIVGVVDDVPIAQLGETPTPTIYRSHLQDSERGMFLTVRTTVEPDRLTREIRSALREIDPDVPLAMPATMEQRIARSRAVFHRRYSMILLAGFSGVALVLSVIGIYGIVSYSVTQRTRELGLRVALGARQRDVMRLILGEGALLAVIGVGSGAVAAQWSTRYLQSLLYGIGAADPATYLAAAALLSGVALVASYFPARRATRIDPMTALRAGE